MIPWAIRSGDIPGPFRDILEEADHFLRMLPDNIGKDPISCHMVCSVWEGLKYPGQWRVGTFWFGCSHSWIELKPNVILDLYPVAACRPQIFFDNLLRTKRLYQPDTSQVDIDDEFTKHRQLIIQALSPIVKHNTELLTVIHEKGQNPIPCHHDWLVDPHSPEEEYHCTRCGAVKYGI